MNINGLTSCNLLSLYSNVFAMLTEGARHSAVMCKGHLPGYSCGLHNHDSVIQAVQWAEVVAGSMQSLDCHWGKGLNGNAAVTLLYQLKADDK